MDDMIVKTIHKFDHTVDLNEVFVEVRKFNVRLNPEKCTFGVGACNQILPYNKENRGKC